MSPSRESPCPHRARSSAGGRARIHRMADKTSEGWTWETRGGGRGAGQRALQLSRGQRERRQGEGCVLPGLAPSPLPGGPSALLCLRPGSQGAASLRQMLPVPVLCEGGRERACVCVYSELVCCVRMCWVCACIGLCVLRRRKTAPELLCVVCTQPGTGMRGSPKWHTQRPSP